MSVAPTKRSKKKQHREIEVRFLEIDVPALKKILKKLGAKDEGEDLLEEVILYDNAGTWNQENKRLRIRTRNGKNYLSYKHHKKRTAEGTEEIEFEVSNAHDAQTLLSRLGYVIHRTQQKRRHTFTLDGVTIDIDHWPRIPAYVELEGNSERALKRVAKKLNLSWKEVVLDEPRRVIEEHYNISLQGIRYFTFDRFE